jgi:hypothetical protein
VPRIYNKGQLSLGRRLEMAVRRVGDWYEMAASLGVSQLEQGVSCASKDVNSEAKEATALATTGENTSDCVLKWIAECVN